MAQSSGNRSTFVTAQRAVAATLRTTLTTGVASAALLALACTAQAQPIEPPASPCDQVSGGGTTVTCSGSIPTGVLLDATVTPSSFTTLNVIGLTTDITPALGDSGVAFISDGNVAVNVATGPFSIVTTGDDAVGILGSSNFGDVTIASSADISTSGANADGIFAFSGSGSVTITSIGNIATDGDDAAAINALSDGNVTITSIGNIATLGDMPDPSTSPYPIGALNGWSASGNTSITSNGNIATAGDYAVGISAVADLDAQVTAFGNISTLGFSAAGIFVSADTATVDSRANIFTQGIMAPGIVVEATGDATIISRGDITTTGVGADGILAISDGTANVTNYGNITAAAYGISAEGAAGNTVVNFGTVQGCPCAGIALMSIAVNAINELTNYGAIIAAPGGNAIESVGDVNVIDNHGIITGNVLMSGFTSEFHNHAGALFNTGVYVQTGDVINDGTIAPGGRGSIQETMLDDNLVQSSSGVYAVDLDPNALSDRNDLLVVFDSATLAGNVAVSMLSLPVTAVDSFIVLQSLSSGIDDRGLGLIASPALHATLLTTANTVEIGIAVDFSTPDGLNPNQRAIAADLHHIYENGVGTLGPALLGLLNVQNLGEYRNALDQLSPEIYSNAEIAALYASSAFSNSLLSCKVNGTDTASIIREGQCLWAGASARFLDSGTTSDQIGFDETAGLFTAGAQVALDNVWRLGAAGGFQSSSLQTATGAQSDGSLAQAGVSLKYNPGQLLLAGAVTGGGGWYDTTRTMSFGGFTGVAEGEQTLGLFNAALRAAYVFGDARLFFKPILDASVTHLELGGFTESGGNGAALSVAGSGNTVFSLAPMLEAGTEWWLGNGTLVRPLIRAGAVWYEGGDFALTASFAGAPAGVSPFTINTDIDEVMGLAGAGVELINGKDSVLRLSYDGQLGETTQIHSVGFKGSAKF